MMSLHVQVYSKYNELPAIAAFATIHFLLTKISYNVTLKYSIFYKLIINFIITVCIHYTMTTLPLGGNKICTVGIPYSQMDCTPLSRWAEAIKINTSHLEGLNRKNILNFWCWKWTHCVIYKITQNPRI